MTREFFLGGFVSKSSQGGAIATGTGKVHTGTVLVMKALASPARLCLAEMLRGGPRSVGWLARRVGLHVSTASQHLAALYAAGLTPREKSTQSVSYELLPLARQLLDETERLVDCVANRPRGGE